ncbi:hypothetical protein AQUCO_01600288v1 [Aquilegia coerulea]|uniref:TOD1/MUCI70 glycosyltransferase-like domain-containing protein n=1 Tax=Aquilegia coerulea TaxID=218851 RepID=A0A2G5DQZ3_AQUCA|nr:hypothetical protein AQUCO_01600288v1 [Aquilegia coerulea]
MDAADVKYVKCRFVVGSGIFDGYDTPHQPLNISLRSQKLFCFLMVVDEVSFNFIKNNGQEVLFPQAQYIIWIHGTMELIVDPLLILGRYFWCGKHIFAITRHKHHQSVYEEANRYPCPLIDLHMREWNHGVRGAFFVVEWMEYLDELKKNNTGLKESRRGLG